MARNPVTSQTGTAWWGPRGYRTIQVVPFDFLVIEIFPPPTMFIVSSTDSRHSLDIMIFLDLFSSFILVPSLGIGRPVVVVKVLIDLSSSSLKLILSVRWLTKSFSRHPLAFEWFTLEICKRWLTV